MLLHVMRHGPAEDQSPSGRDFDRALTPTGREVVARAASALFDARAASAHGVRLLTSPLLRAVQTAAIVATACKEPLQPEEHPELAAEQDMPLALVRALAVGGVDAILVGHQPTVQELVQELGVKGALLPGGFRTAMVVTLDVEPAAAKWRLLSVIDPHRGEASRSP
jgi:phosphohistidine phosphatase